MNRYTISGGATPGHVKANALAELPPPWLPL